MSRPILSILIGYPRAGKTTFVNNKMADTVIISADQFRQLMYGQRFYANGEAMMWATRDICLKILMKQGANIIIDETNISCTSRAKLVKLAKEYNYSVEVIWIDTPAPICMDRARATDQADLIPIITKMQAQFDPPALTEGFNRIVYIGEDSYYKNLF